MAAYPTPVSPSPAELREPIDRLLAARDAAFPRREPENTRALDAALSAYLDWIEVQAQRLPAPPQTDAAAAGRICDRPIFIGGAMKSGTTLMAQLLDDHPELVVFPGDGHLLGNARRPEAESEDAFRRRWIDHWLRRMINPTGQRPFWLLGPPDPPYILFRQGLAAWWRRLPPDPTRPIRATVLAYREAVHPATASARLWVEKTPGNELQAERIWRCFPAARLIVVVRDPRPNLASLKRLFGYRGWPWHAGKAARDIRASHRAALDLPRRLGPETVFRVHYESLVQRPRAVMTALADWLGIEFRPELLRPTVGGRPATANSMYRHRQTAGRILPNSHRQWEKQLTAAELAEAAGHLLPDARRLGYAWRPAPKLHPYIAGGVSRLKATVRHRHTKAAAGSEPSWPHDRLADVDYTMRRFAIDRFLMAQSSRLAPGIRVLELGSGRMRRRGLFAPERYGFRVTHVDIEPHRRPHVQADAAALPFLDESFDAVFLAEVLEHVYRPPGVLGAVRRALKPDGVLLATVPFMVPIHSAPSDYGRYTDAFWQRALAEAGFDAIQITAQGNLTWVGLDLLRNLLIGGSVRVGRTGRLAHRAGVRTLGRFRRHAAADRRLPDGSETVSLHRRCPSGYALVARRPVKPTGIADV